MKKRTDQLHIGFFGRTNVGKSSIINAIAQQQIAIVSDVKGTTTDPVKKSIEILEVGNVVLIDTAGIDDTTELGAQRLEKTAQVLSQIDLAVVVVENYTWEHYEDQIVKSLDEFKTPYFIINNKSDLIKDKKETIQQLPVLNIDTLTFEHTMPLVESLQRWVKEQKKEQRHLLDGYISENQTVLLITPIDSEAPEGRMILPQVQMIRNILDNHAIVVALRENQLAYYLQHYPEPNLIVTDSQIFKEVSETIPPHIPLTSFSIILAHEKGNFHLFIESLQHIAKLKDGDHILVLESCTHHSSCEDIGRVKIPKWLQSYTKKQLHFTFVPSLQPIENIEQYAFAVQCGGCMVTQKQLHNRVAMVAAAKIPITNYGLLIAYLNGILERAQFFM